MAPSKAIRPVAPAAKPVSLRVVCEPAGPASLVSCALGVPVDEPPREDWVVAWIESPAEVRTRKASIATAGWPWVPTTPIVIRWRPMPFQAILNRTLVDREVAEYVLTVFSFRPSIQTIALPRVGPTGPIQETAEPTKVSDAFALGRVE